VFVRDHGVCHIETGQSGRNIQPKRWKRHDHAERAASGRRAGGERAASGRRAGGERGAGRRRDMAPRGTAGNLGDRP
jgi:hypothetical protein